GSLYLHHLYNLRRTSPVSRHQLLPKEIELFRKENGRTSQGEGPSRGTHIQQVFSLSPRSEGGDIPGEDDFEFISLIQIGSPSSQPTTRCSLMVRVRYMYPVFDRGLSSPRRRNPGLELDLQELPFCELRSCGLDRRHRHHQCRQGGWHGRWRFKLPLVDKIATAVAGSAVKRASTGPRNEKAGEFRDLLFGRSRSDGDEKLVILPAREHKVVGNRRFFRSNLDDAYGRMQRQRRS
ncbi:hypothetical protein HPP92_028986, partial [Vanilla planifolia]